MWASSNTQWSMQVPLTEGASCEEERMRGVYKVCIQRTLKQVTAAATERGGMQHVHAELSAVLHMFGVMPERHAAHDRPGWCIKSSPTINWGVRACKNALMPVQSIWQQALPCKCWMPGMQGTFWGVR